MGYNEEYGKHMEAYKDLLTQYNELTESKQYREVHSSMPFEFLSARQLAETLELYSEVGADSQFKFTRASDAISFYRSVLDLRKNISGLLESATCIAKASEIAERVNELVDDSPFLPDTLKLQEPDRIAEMAKECLSLLPKYPELLTKAFRRSFIESCIECLPVTEITQLADAGIVKAADLNNIRLVGTDAYKSNVRALQERLGVDHLLAEHHQVRLAGTSFANEDGTSRQDILKELVGVKDVLLQCIASVFVPEVGDPKNAVGVFYDGKMLGYVPQDVVNAMYKKYNDPQFEAKLLNVIGSSTCHYGCEVDLGVVAKEYMKQTETPER